MLTFDKDMKIFWSLNSFLPGEKALTTVKERFFFLLLDINIITDHLSLHDANIYPILSNDVFLSDARFRKHKVFQHCIFLCTQVGWDLRTTQKRWEEPSLMASCKQTSTCTLWHVEKAGRGVVPLWSPLSSHRITSTSPTVVTQGPCCAGLARFASPLRTTNLTALWRKSVLRAQADLWPSNGSTAPWQCPVLWETSATRGQRTGRPASRWCHQSQRCVWWSAHQQMSSWCLPATGCGTPSAARSCAPSSTTGCVSALTWGTSALKSLTSVSTRSEPAA